MKKVRVTKRQLGAYVRKLLIESTAPPVSINPVTPINNFTRKFSKLSVVWTTAKYQKNIVYNANNNNFKNWFPKISSEMISKLNTAADWKNFLEEKIQGTAQAFYRRDDNTDEVRAETETGDTDIWMFGDDENGQKQKDMAANAILSANAGAAGDIGESLGGALVIPRYGASKGYVGTVFDCNNPPFSSNFPSVDLFVGQSAAEAFPSAKINEKTYEMPGVYVSSKLSTDKTVYVTMKEMSLVRLFATVLDPNGKVYYGEEFNNRFNEILGDNCEEVTLKYAFCSGGTTRISSPLEEIGPKATGANPTVAAGLGQIAPRAIFDITITANKFLLELYKALYDCDANQDFSDGYYLLTNDGKEPIDPDTGKFKQDFLDNVEAANLKTATGALMSFAKTAVLKKNVLKNSDITNLPFASDVPIGDLQSQVDDLKASTKTAVDSVLNNPNTSIDKVFYGKYNNLNDNNKKEIIDAAVQNSLDLTLRDLTGLSSTDVIQAPSQNLQKMIHMYLTQPVEIKLAVIDESKEGNNRTWKIVFPDMSEIEIENVTSKDRKVVDSAEAAHTKLGMVFDLVCGVSFSEGTSAFISALNDVSLSQDDFVSKMISELGDILSKSLSPFKKVALPQSISQPSSSTITPTGSGNPLTIDFSSPVDSQTTDYRVTSKGAQTYLEMSVIIRTIQEEYNKTIAEIEEATKYIKIAIAFKKVFEQSLDIIDVSQKLDTSAENERATILGNQSVHIKRAIAQKKIAIEYISKEAKEVHINNGASIDQIRGAIIAAIGVVNAVDFKELLKEQLNLASPPPPDFGDEIFGETFNESMTRLIINQVLREVMMTPPPQIDMSTLVYDNTEVPKALGEFIINSFKLGLAMIVFAAKIGSDTMTLELNVNTIADITFQNIHNETVHESRLYESILFDLMEAATKKQQSVNQPKKIKITKRQLNRLIETSLKKNINESVNKTLEDMLLSEDDFQVMQAIELLTPLLEEAVEERDSSRVMSLTMPVFKEFFKLNHELSNQRNIMSRYPDKRMEMSRQKEEYYDYYNSNQSEMRQHYGSVEYPYEHIWADFEKEIDADEVKTQSEINKLLEKYALFKEYLDISQAYHKYNPNLLDY